MKPRTTRKPPRAEAAASASSRFDRYAPLLVVVGLLALLWAARGAPLGSPVADDYAFLYRLRFQHPLDPFDSMGAAFYWRPLSRQLYFSLLGPLLFKAPWIVPLLSAELLVLLFAIVYRVARRALPGSALAAAAIALFPVTSESARVLLDWPSGAQHLLAMVFAALAVHEAQGRRAVTATLCILAGVLSHESVAIALPVVVLLLARTEGAARDRFVRGKALLKALAPALAVALLWLVGYVIARRHGVALPVAAPGASPVTRLPGLYGHALVAQLDLEDLKEPGRGLLVIAYGMVIALGVASLYAKVVRRRLAEAGPTLGVALAWFVVGTLPLVVLLPDWNAWRDSVPGLGFGFALVGLLAVVSPRLALAFAGVRMVALLAAAPAAPAPTAFPAVTATDMSFVRLARLQGIANDTRTALLTRHPTLPVGSDAHFASLPRMAEVGLEGPLAIRVWYGDSTLTWGTFTSARGFDRPNEVVVAYDSHLHWGATVVEPSALATFGNGAGMMMAMRLPQADSLMEASRKLQPRRSDEFESLIVANQARIALTMHDFARADSLIRDYQHLVGSCADFYGLHSGLELGRGRYDRAEADLNMCLRLEPHNKIGLVVRDAFNQAIAQQGAAATAGGPGAPGAP